MFDPSWLLRAAAAAIVVVSVPAGFAEAVVRSIDGPAEASEWAERGERFDLGTTPYGLPVADVEGASWGDTHSSYPATDIFVGCGATIVSPVDGVVLEVRRIDSYDPAVDDPATRGGRSVTILGDDGVRYYFAHFDEIAADLAVDTRVDLGEAIGTMGDTGRSSACHLHFGISPPCPGKEWRVRRGTVWPGPYLDAWKRAEQLSPAEEVAAWAFANPNACAEAMADPGAAGA